MFISLQKSILGGLLTDDNQPKIKDDGVSETDIEGKFKNYIRRSEV